MGIGNIGNEYQGTRHNVGFDFIDELIGQYQVIEKKKLAYSDTYMLSVEDRKVLAVKPTTYVNLSGNALEELMRLYDFSLVNLLVIVDDFHLPLAKIRIRKKGSAAGHNGMKSIIAVIGENFTRLRFGIGPLPEDIGIVDFVLGKFTTEELEVYKEKLKESVKVVPSLITNGIDKTMNQFNS